MSSQSDERRLATRLLGGTARNAFTLAVVGVSVAVTVFGAQALSQRAAAAPTPVGAPPIPVATRALVVEDGYTVSRSFVGQVEPARSVALSFELPGKVDVVEVEEGETVRQGDVVARQDTRLIEADIARLTASRSALQARMEFASRTLDRNSELNTRGFASSERLDSAIASRDELAARIAEVDAALLEAEIRRAKATLTAPMDGRVTVRRVDGGESLSTGQPVLTVVSTGAPVVRVGLPLDLIDQLAADATITIGGRDHAARLQTVRPDIDPVTRTRTALFTLVDADEAVFGQTARLMLSQRVEAAGSWVPLRSLKENAGGIWTILTLGADGRVRLAAVEVLHADGDRVFVRGSFPEGTLAIDEGPQRVAPGQAVRPIGDS
ncbi:efflux RND transporter periplasmic adaptor subunit [Palleronia sp. KMU-117]|uniref:efflux RND transporter periplasmic adaptor subunit n=1 Tax=Palleronia sp. KMU-117 TaxID=3434108 RepID=UPI003D765CD7